MDPERVSTIEEWQPPESHREVQVFLGFANFYRRFICSYSCIVAPMTDMLKGSVQGKKTSPFTWTDEANRAFVESKRIFSNAPFLRHFDPDKQSRVETDASGFGLGAILSQQDKAGHWRPVAFWSCKMNPAEQNYETHDQELLAIVAAFKQWRHYLEGAFKKFLVLTDHSNLQGFNKVQRLNARQFSGRCS